MATPEMKHFIHLVLVCYFDRHVFISIHCPLQRLFFQEAVSDARFAGFVQRHVRDPASRQMYTLPERIRTRPQMSAGFRNSFENNYPDLGTQRGTEPTLKKKKSVDISDTEEKVISKFISGFVQYLPAPRPLPFPLHFLAIKGREKRISELQLVTQLGALSKYARAIFPVSPIRL